MGITGCTAYKIRIKMQSFESFESRACSRSSLTSFTWRAHQLAGSLAVNLSKLC